MILTESISSEPAIVGVQKNKGVPRKKFFFPKCRVTSPKKVLPFIFIEKRDDHDLVTSTKYRTED